MTESGGGSPKKAPAKKAPANRKRTRRASALEQARTAPMSRYFARAFTRARNIINDPKALLRLVDEANNSAANRNVLFAAVFDDFQASIRLVVAHARGTYHVRPLTLVTVVAGLVYVVSPIDVLPDLVPVVGWSDDAIVIAWVLKTVQDQLDAFRAWEVGRYATFIADADGVVVVVEGNHHQHRAEDARS